MVLLPATARAQPEAATTQELVYWLQPGERVNVTGALPCDDVKVIEPEAACVAGLALRTVSGRVTVLPDHLVVVRGEDRQIFRLEGIERVERPKDRIWNGALIGYALGVAPFAVMELQCRSEPGCWEGLPLAVGVVISGPIGFGIGALTDALIHRPRVVFSRAAPRSGASVSPILTRHSAAVRVSLVF